MANDFAKYVVVREWSEQRCILGNTEMCSNCIETFCCVPIPIRLNCNESLGRLLCYSKTKKLVGHSSKSLFEFVKMGLFVAKRFKNSNAVKPAVIQMT